MAGVVAGEVIIVRGVAIVARGVAIVARGVAIVAREAVIVMGSEEVFQRGQKVELLEKEEVFFRRRDGDRTQELGVIALTRRYGAKDGFVDAFHCTEVVKEMGHRLLVLRLDGCSDGRTHAHAFVE